MKQLVVLILLITLSACSGGGAVVFAPTPLPPEAVPNQFTHPSGAFTVLLPRTWTLYQQSTSLFASASFSAPDYELPLVQISAVNLGEGIASTQLGDIMQEYQNQVRPDVNRYTEQDRQAMGDGSWRITGLRRTTAGETLQINTFIQANGSVLAVIEVTVPHEAALRTQTQTIINTFSLADTADLPVSDLSILSGAAQSQIQIVNLNTWTTANGVFYVTGEVTNSGEVAIAELPVRTVLMTESGQTLADGVDTVMGHAIESGGFAPFSIRFGQGQPVNATRYSITLGSESFDPEPITVVGFPVLQWEDATETNAEGAIFITGSVTNTGEDDLLTPRAIATLFDDAGRVIAAAFANAETTILPAGETTNFTILISELGGVASNYVVNVQALPCDASCE